MKLSIEELLNFNRQGLVPGPSEQEEDFLTRCRYCLSLKANIKEQIPYLPDESSSEAILNEAFAKTKSLYDIEPTWIPLFFSNYKLSPWHGGCAWIFQQEENSPTGAFFQLRQAFRNSDTYLGLYHRDELIEHELVHVGRMKFEEPQFEELLAYKASRSKWRRYFGPLIQAPWESALFAFTLLVIFILDLSLIAMGSSQIYQSLLWLKLIPLTLILYALARVAWRQKQMRECLNKLIQAVDDSKKANAILFRLQDKEIKSFGKMTKEEIWKYVLQQKENSLRWKVISEAYFRD